VEITSARTAAVVDRIFGSLAKGRGGWVVTANLDFLQRASESIEVRQLYHGADLILPDGVPLLWAAHLQGRPLPEHVTGSDLVWILADAAAREERSLYLLGGAGDAASRAASRLSIRFPSLRVVGFSSPQVSLPPTPSEIEFIRRELKQVRPDLLYVGFGSPKQEYVIDALRRDFPATWMMGCGISLSFLAGDIPRAPVWMQRVGLEWFHRMVHEPRRLAPRYLQRNLPFALRLLLASWRSRGSAPDR